MNRTNAELREWLKERKERELEIAPVEQNTPASGMTMGAIETLHALNAWLDGDDEA